MAVRASVGLAPFQEPHAEFTHKAVCLKEGLACVPTAQLARVALAQDHLVRGLGVAQW